MEAGKSTSILLNRGIACEITVYTSLYVCARVLFISYYGPSTVSRRAIILQYLYDLFFDI